MKVCLLSNATGGASVGAYRLHQGLRHSGINSTMLVGDKKWDDHTVMSPKSKFFNVRKKFAYSLDSLPLMLYPQRDQTTFSVQWLPEDLSSQIAQLNPDLISLQWVGKGYLQIETLARLNKPLVWTLRDMWAFTGGCHYSQDCDRYVHSCGTCPHLSSSKKWDLSRWIWQRKAKSWQNLNLTIVSISSWLAKCARSSSLFKDVRIEVIPNGIDTRKYRPINQDVARDLLGLPKDKRFILFGALQATSQRRKGFHLLQPALQKLSQQGCLERLELVIFGASQPENPPDLGFKAHYLGVLKDDLSLALAYSAADVFVAPSTQEAFGNTVLESLACGTPCVAFNIGGIPDMIEHLINGYLAQPFDVEDLAQGIVWVLQNEEKYQKLANRAREKVEKQFAIEIPAQQYQSLFTELLSNSLKSQ